MRKADAGNGRGNLTWDDCQMKWGLMRFRWDLFACALVLTCSGSVRAAWILDFPIRAEDPLPEWVTSQPMEWENTGFRRVDIPMAALPEGVQLAVTVVYQEQGADELNVVWLPNHSVESRMVARNLIEGVAGWNQRTILLPPEFTERPGSLIFDSEGSGRVIHRLVFSMLREAQSFVPAARETDAVIALPSRLIYRNDLEAEGGTPPPDSWSGNIGEAWLQEAPEVMDGGVEFVVEINPAPQRAILRFEINGRGDVPEVWVNGRKLADISLELPPLRDPAYLTEIGNSSLVYAGWRSGWARIPEGLLRPGENSFRFFSSTLRDSIRGARLELGFPNPVAPPPSSAFGEIPPFTLMDEVLPDLSLELDDGPSELFFQDPLLP